MSWIRSEKALLHHPKTAHLKVLLKADTPTVIGKLHMLWWWCLDYALDGNLAKQEGKVIEDACGIPLRQLIRAGFVDSRPYRRIHDWWDNQGNYLKVRFRDQPEIWSKIKESYDAKSPMGKHMGKHEGKTMDVDLISKRTDVRTDVALKEDARGSSLGAPPALGTERPMNAFDLAHVERRLTNIERVQTKLREAGFLNGKP